MLPGPADAIGVASGVLRKANTILGPVQYLIFPKRIINLLP